MTSFLRSALAGLVLVSMLSGCALMPERLVPGTPRADIVQRLGAPSAEYPLPDGTRLQYSRQPAGQQVYNLDLDTQGRLRKVEQVLDIFWMQQNIAIDRWTRDDVLRHMGRPALVERVWSFTGDIWTYRFLEYNNPRQAHVHIDPQGVVRKLVFTDERRMDDFPGRD
ncbi:MAG: hypothetical protein ACO1OR_03400 [Hydrogenophaga sp.]|jgi:hypothetical protein|uniref:hypothetical protein n=1 Tax=Hydrogenophaga intermedia TaxID=65786 RepID=UPI002043B769|nr:hypothetical protein [Hydrogenophaga intermedia]MCM3564354.1 hypothetical protein [Hydrogenophaga intermedia]